MPEFKMAIDSSDFWRYVSFEKLQKSQWNGRKRKGETLLLRSFITIQWHQTSLACCWIAHVVLLCVLSMRRFSVSTQSARLSRMWTVALDGRGRRMPAFPTVGDGGNSQKSAHRVYRYSAACCCIIYQRCWKDKCINNKHGDGGDKL